MRVGKVRGSERAQAQGARGCGFVTVSETRTHPCADTHTHTHVVHVCVGVCPCTMLARTREHAQTIQIYPSSRDLHPKSYITYRESRTQAAQEEMANHNRNLILGIHVRYTPLPPPLPPPILLRLLVCDVSHPSTNLIHALSPPQSLSFVICNRSRCQTRTRVYTPASTRTRCEDEH